MTLVQGKRRIYLGSEMASIVSRFPSRVDEDDDDDRVPQGIDLGALARLARTAQRGCIDFLSVDDTAAGNPPFSGRKRGALDALKLAARLASATEGIYLLPQVNAARAEPAGLLAALVALEATSEGRHGWELELPAPSAHAEAQNTGHTLAALVQDTWSGCAPLTKLAKSARAMRQKWLRENAGQVDGAAPLLAVRGEKDHAVMLGTKHAHVIRISAADQADAGEQRSQLRALATEAGRDADEMHVLVDLPITLATEASHGEARRDLAEEMIGQPIGGGNVQYAGHPAGLAEMCSNWADAEACDGFTFMPTSLPLDLRLVVDQVVPPLIADGYIAGSYSKDTKHLKTPRAVPVPPPREPAMAGASPEAFWD